MAGKNFEAFDRQGRRIADDIDVLPDGATLRVRMMARDGMSDLQRAIAADKAARFDDSQARHGPGPIYADRSAALAVYEDEKRAAQEAWRTPSEDRRRRKGTARDPFGRETGSWEEVEEEDALPAAPAVPRPTYDAAEGRRIKKAAYDEYVRDLENAWRNPRP